MPQPDQLHIILSQLNLTVGDLTGNAEKMRDAYLRAAEKEADLICFPELNIIGYPPEDLIFTPKLQQDAIEEGERMAALTKDHPTAILMGNVWRDGEALYNAAFLLDKGRVIHRQAKHHLPNYGVFDEKRVFDRGPLPEVIIWRGIRLGIFVCEDMWGSKMPGHMAAQSPDLLISINASPFEPDKQDRRESLAGRVAAQANAPVLYLNQVGGQDELVFDGGSLAANASGGITARLPRFREYDGSFFWKKESVRQLHNHHVPEHWERQVSIEEAFYRAMVISLRDYVEKNGFGGVLLGLSGGIDSALTVCIAADALGPEQVHSVMLPSPYTSDISKEDARALAENLGVTYEVIPIEQGMQATEAMLSASEVALSDLAKENIQSRLRGLILMGLSNSSDKLLVTTGNKSELAVGYATLYGDMCGAFSVLKDVYKTDVYRLSEWRNTHMPGDCKGPEGEVIPRRIIERPPSAELRENQRDEDSLPPYELLDAILHDMVEGRLSVEEIIAKGFEEATVRDVAHLLFASEYKRRQAPPGVKLTSMAFGRDRRFPLTNRFSL